MGVFYNGDDEARGGRDSQADIYGVGKFYGVAGHLACHNRKFLQGR